jgi:hypothetical protein
MALNITEAVNQAAFDNMFVDDAGAQPDYIAAGMVNDVSFDRVRIVELEPNGSCVVFGAYTPDETKPDEIINAVVIAPTGKEMIFKDSGAALSFANRMSYGDDPDYPIEYVRCIASKAVGDPVAIAKSQYAAHVKEAAFAADSVVAITPKLDSAAALGWDEKPLRSQERIAYGRYEQAQAALEDWEASVAERTAKLRDVLVAAGINPATVALDTTTPTPTTPTP